MLLAARKVRAQEGAATGAISCTRACCCLVNSVGADLVAVCDWGIGDVAGLQQKHSNASKALVQSALL